MAHSAARTLFAVLVCGLVVELVAVEQKTFVSDPSCAIHIGLLSRSTKSLYQGLAGQLAIHHIQTANTALVRLPEGAVMCANVTYELLDTLGLASEGVKAALGWGSSVDAIVGASRSAVSGVTSLASQIYDVPVVSYASTAASLSDKDNYPMFHRTVPPDAIAASVMAKMCLEFKFVRVGTMFVNDAYGSGYANDFATAGAQYDIDVIVSAKYTSGTKASIRSAVKSLSDAGVRVIILIAFNKDLQAILDAAQEFELVQKEGVSWITADAIADPEGFAASAANPAQVRDQLAGWLSVFARPLSGESRTAFEAEGAAYRALNSSNVYGTPHSKISVGWSGFDAFSSFMYDAVWLSALAASNKKSALATPAPIACTGENADVCTTVSGQMKSIRFTATSGVVSLLENGDRSGDGLSYAVFNWRRSARRSGELHEVEIGTWGSESGFQFDIEPLWPGHKEAGWQYMPRGIELCPSGTEFDFVTSECVSCPEGTYSSGVACRLCERGTVGPTTGMAKCVPCQGGYADEEGMSVCKECPENSEIRAGSNSLAASDCSCLPGSYLPTPRPSNTSSSDQSVASGSNVQSNVSSALAGWAPTCRRCAAGANCAGGDSPPYPKFGHWGEVECLQYGGSVDCPEWDTFIQCSPLAACTGGPDFACGVGRSGRMCMSIAEDYFNVGAMFFFKCNGSAGVAGTSFAILATIVAWLGMNTIASSNYDALDIALLFLQITGMVAAFPLRWHSYLDVLNTALGVVNFEVDFVSPCPSAFSAEALFYVQLMLPIIFAFGYGSWYLVKNIFAKRWPNKRLLFGKVWRDMRGHVLGMIIVGYHQICLKTFGALKCQTFQDGHSYLKMAPEIECWVGRHWAMACVAAVYLIVVVFGVPLGVFFYTRRKRLDNELEVQSGLNFLYERYEVDWIWWHSVLIVRRMIIAFILMVVDTPMIQGASASVILAAFIVVHSAAQPFIDDSLDKLEIVTLLGIECYTLSGLMFFPSLSDATQGFVCPGDGEDICGGENANKARIAIAVIVLIVVLILVCFKVTFSNIVDKTREVKAVKSIRTFLEISNNAKNTEGQKVNKLKGGARAALQAARADNAETPGLDTQPSLVSMTPTMSPFTKALSPNNKALSLKELFSTAQDDALKYGVKGAFEGANSRALETVLEPHQLSRWARWVATKSPEGQDAAKMKAASLFSTTRAHFNSIEGVGEHCVTSLRQVIQGATAIEGFLDWLAVDSTAEDRAQLTSIFRRVAERNEAESDESSRYSQLVRPFWRPTLVWFIIRSSAERQSKCRGLLDSIHTHGTIQVYKTESNKVAASEEEGVPKEAKDGSVPLGLGDKIYIAVSKVQDKLSAVFGSANYINKTVFMPNAPERRKGSVATESLFASRTPSLTTKKIEGWSLSSSVDIQPKSTIGSTIGSMENLQSVVGNNPGPLNPLNPIAVVKAVPGGSRMAWGLPAVKGVAGGGGGEGGKPLDYESGEAKRVAQSAASTPIVVPAEEDPVLTVSENLDQMSSLPLDRATSEDGIGEVQTNRPA